MIATTFEFQHVLCRPEGEIPVVVFGMRVEGLECEDGQNVIDLRALDVNTSLPVALEPEEEQEILRMI